ncbi:histidine phosphatase family protein [Pseudomonas frederiksbergensis]|uniref:Histidine phosphatase family protein n=2 Tax=Pseudomonas frederiksbergensis TaxID=104087 RepID=A0A423KH55_9PSED|nr:histidine phosphatase family protein [Pseudomonas frederiksbergensis]
MFESVSSAIPSRRWMPSRLTRIVGVSALVMVAALVTGFVIWHRSPADLGSANAQTHAELLQHWRAGDVVVLVRHAERCDRSSNPCLGPADGITQLGSQSASAVGQGFVRLGMAQTDVFASPVTRTEQTAHYMFGKEATNQEWLASCGKTLRDDVIAHKVAHRNTVLVTHSGCISDFEVQTGFKHAKASEYSSSLFASIGTDGQLKVLGVLNADDWHSLLSDKALK